MSISFSNDTHINLHNHTAYSTLDGLCKPELLIARAKELGQDALAITDHGNLGGVYKFYKHCKDQGIKSILGQEFYVANYDQATINESGLEPRLIKVKHPLGEASNHHLVLLAYNQQGYKNLVELSTIAYLEGMYYKPRIDFDTLARHKEGLICGTACMMGVVGGCIAPKNEDIKLPAAIQTQWDREGRAREQIERYHNLFGDKFYLELMDHGIPEEQIINNFLIVQARSRNIPLVITNDIHFINRADYDAYEQLRVIGKTGKTKDETTEGDGDIDNTWTNMYLKNIDELAVTFQNAIYDHLLDESYNISQMVEEVSPVLDKKIFPVYHQPKPYESPFDELNAIVSLEMVKRGFGDNQVYRDRLEYEMGVIRDKEFADVFMIVYKHIYLYAKERGIMIGPGRGSGASSLVLWLLGVTFLDPIKEGLIFERFIDPERNEIPDIDIDVDPEYRQEILQHLRDVYAGSSNIAQIKSYGTLGPKQVLNDLATAANSQGNAELANVIRLMSSRVLTDAYVRDEGVVSDVSLDYCFKNDKGDPSRGIASLSTIYTQYEDSVKDTWQTALTMEGIPRHASTHAGGVVFIDEAYTDMVPLQLAGAIGTHTITQFDMSDLEAIGVGKLDVLGLNNLSVISKACSYIRKLGDDTFDVYSPFWQNEIFDNPTVFEHIASGKTRGIFQLEAPAFTKFITEVKPSNFQEVADALALFRPGPLGDMDSGELSVKDNYCMQKDGRSAWTFNEQMAASSDYLQYIHPDLYKILSDTKGIIIYQEQVMKIASEIAGLTRTEGYKIIKAISKKIHKDLIKWKSAFIDGCVAKGYGQEWSEKLWQSIEKFAGYSFNMAHAKSYAVITCWTAYLSMMHPTEFFCAYLNTPEISKKPEKKREYMTECRRRGVDILPPDINKSGVDFTPLHDGDYSSIVYGLRSVKQVAKSAEVIVTEREKNGLFSRYDIDPSVGDEENEKAFLARIAPGQANKTVKDSLMNVGAFDSIYPPARQWAINNPELRAENQMKLLGAVFDFMAVMAQKSLKAIEGGLGVKNIGDLEWMVQEAIETGQSIGENSGLIVVGIITDLQTRKTHKGGSFGAGTISDNTSSMAFVCFDPTWTVYGANLQLGKIVKMVGSISIYNNLPQFRVSKIEKLLWGQ